MLLFNPKGLWEPGAWLMQEEQMDQDKTSYYKRQKENRVKVVSISLNNTDKSGAD